MLGPTIFPTDCKRTDAIEWVRSRLGIPTANVEFDAELAAVVAWVPADTPDELVDAVKRADKPWGAAIAFVIRREGRPA